MRIRAWLLSLVAVGVSFQLAFPQTSFRKIVGADLPIQGISATVTPANPTIPKNTPAGVQIVVSTASGNLSSSDLAKFLGGPIQVTGELSGPGLPGAVPLPQPAGSGGGTPVVDPLILPIPALTEAGNYTLTNLKILVNGNPALDINPSTVPLNVIDQVLITSVETTPLTLDQIKAAGVILDSSDFIGFQFTIGLATSSNVATISFPAVFDRNGVPLPQSLMPPQPPPRTDVPVPTILPVMLNLCSGVLSCVPSNTATQFNLPDGTPVQPRVPGVLVIPGDVGFLKQFFSAQLFVANGSPGGSGLVVHDVTGKINLPVPPSGLATDDPLSLPDLHGSPQPATKPVKGVGPDGITGTADDVNALNPGDQGEAEFIIRGEKEGFYPISFDINGTLDGLATGSVTVSGTAQGGVLVRNPFFDMTFAVPSVVRAGETFKMFVTIKNISQTTANLLTVSLDQGQLSGCTLIGNTDQQIPTLAAGASQTVSYTFNSLVTGQVVASYLHFDTSDGTTGALKFTLGVGERGVPLSPDTLALPSSVNNLPDGVVSAAMRVLGEGWSVANAPTGTLPPGVIRTSKAVVTQKGLALAEAGLRIQLGEQPQFALRDLLSDFFGGNPIDPGFDQVLRTTDAGQDFQRAVGAALAQYAVASGILSFQNDASNVLASGRDFISFALTNGSSAPPVTLTVADGNGKAAQGFGLTPQVSDTIPGFAQAPLGNVDASPILGLLTSPTAFPYTLQFPAASSGTFDLAITMPHGDGSFIRGTISGVTVTQGLNSRIVLDISQPDRLILEQDTNRDGTYATTKPLTTSIISASGPTLLTANVVDSATVPGASLLGVYAAVLFDRVVDSNSAQQTSNYQILSNAVQQAKPVYSGRIVVAALQQPEGPYVPTSISVSGVADSRGVVGGSLNVPLQGNLLQDPGGVVTGHVLNADGTPVNNVVVTYSNYSSNDCNQQGAPGPVSTIPVDGNGRYQIRYVHQQGCGAAFKVATNDPNSGALREVNDFVRFGGEQLVVDLTLLGRGNVSGTVRDTNGVPQSGATVVVLSQTDLQVGAQTTTNGNGQYSVSGITVGPVTVQAAKGVGLGHSTGNIARAGTTATVDVTLDTGAISVSGTLFKQVNGGPLTPVPNFPVVYGLDTQPPFLPPQAQGVVNTDGNGNFVFTAVPEGNFVVYSQLTVRDIGRSSGSAIAGAAVTGLNVVVKIDDTSFATVSGKVFLPDQTPVAGVVVLGPGGAGGVLTDGNGAYSLQGIPISSTSQTITAQTGDGLRQGTAKVLVTQAGQVVNNVNITLSGLGTAQFTVLDANGKPVAGQAVALTYGCNSACGCNPVQITTTSTSVTVTSNPLLTNAQGVAVWPSPLPVGAVGAIAVSSTQDVAAGTAFIPGDKQTGSGVLRFAGSGTVAGSVLDPDGRPSFGATLALRANVFDPLTCTLAPGDAASVQTDTSGTFNFAGVHAGPVAVTASQVFSPAPVGKSGVLANAQTLVFNLQLVNTTAGVFSGTVFLPDGVTPAGAGVQVTASGALPDVTVSTDANSHFQFAKIFPGGGYTVTVRDPASGGVAQDTVFLPAGQNGNLPPDVTHNFRLKGKGTITVQVVDGSNQPVTNATVTLTENSFPNAVHEGEIQPANQGVVTLTDVFEGPFSVTATDNVGRGGRTSNTLPGPGASVSVTVQLTSTGTVQGHFFMPDGVTGIPFASVSLSANGRQIGQVTTDSANAGFYSFTFVPAGPVLLQAQDPVTGRTGFASGTIQKDGDTLPLDVIAEGLGTVQGMVTLNGANQAGADVDIFSGNYHAATVTDSTGHYMVTGVPVGHIVVNAGFTNNFLLGTNSAALSTDGSTIEIDVALRGSGSIQGTVVQSDQKTPAAGAVLTVTVGGQGGGTQSVSADAGGNFSFSIVPEGIATLNASFGDIDRGQLVVDVPAGAPVTPAPIVILNGVGSISGHTQDGLGNNIAGHLTITGTGAFPYTFAVDTNPDGLFQLPEVLAGNFTANLTVVNGTITTSGTVFSSVTPNANTDIVVPLQATAAVKGIVLRSDGVTPATGANVTVSVGAGHSIVVQAQTDGSFNASGIPLGALTVSINDPVSTGQALILGQSLTTAGQTFDLDTLFPPVTRIILNDTPMTALSITPANGTSGVTSSTAIVVTFSNPLASTAGIQIVSAKRGNLNLPFTLSPDGKVATFTGLPSSDQITVTATTDVTDNLGRHPLQPLTATFFVGPPDVVSITPPANKNQIATGATIAVTFREPLAASTNLASLIVVSSLSGPVAGTTTLATPTQAVFTPAAALPTDTVFTVTVNGATDLGGIVQTVPFVSTFATIDTIPPTLVVAPANGIVLSTSRPTITLTASDNLTGVDVTSPSIVLDNQLVATGVLSFTPAANLPDGSHTVTASIKDLAGNLTTTSSTFIIDTAPPAAPVLSGVSENQILVGNVVISASASDPDGIKQIDLLLDNSVLLSLLPPTFQHTLITNTINEGPHTLAAVAVDNAGNRSPASPQVDVIVNNQQLTVTVTSPANGTRFRNSITVVASVSETDVRHVDFTLGTQTISVTSPPYTAIFDLTNTAEGSQTIQVNAVGFGTETASTSVGIVVDHTPPAVNAALIAAFPPSNGFSNVAGQPGATEAAALVQITNTNAVSNNQVTTTAAANGSFSVNIAGSVGDTLSLTATDSVGNTSSPITFKIRAVPPLPQVAQVQPADGSTNVPLNVHVVVRFASAVSPAAVVAGTLQLLQGSTPVAGTVTLSSDGLSLTFTPNQNLAGTTAYTVVVQDIAGGATSPEFQSGFTTAVFRDTTPPTVVSFSPPISATGVPINAPIQVLFSKQMDPATLTTANFSVSDNQGVTIGGVVQVSPDGRTATFMPAAFLPVGRQINWSLNSRITDSNGNALGGQSFNFSTAFAAQVQPPTLVSISPPDQTTGVPTNTKITLQFSEPIDPVTAPAGIQVLLAGQPVPGALALTSGNTIATFTPSAVLSPNTSYNISVTNSITDLAENLLANPATTSFTTAAGTSTTGPTVVATDPLNNAVGVGTNAVLHVQFSERVNTLSVNGATVQVLRNSDSLLIQPTSLTVSADGLSATWTGTLAASTVYRFTFFGGVTDLAGNQVVCCSQITFTTGTGADVQTPVAVATSPVNGASGVALNARVEVEYNEALDVVGLGQPVVVTSGSGTVAGSVSLNTDRTTVIFVPSSALSASTSYTVNASGVKDVEGNVAAPVTFSFTTGTAADTTALTVVATTPANSTTAPVTTPISWTFNKAIDPTSVNSNSGSSSLALIYNGGVNSGGIVAGSYAVNGAVVTFTPAGPLPANQQFVMRVNTSINGIVRQVMDYAGNMYSSGNAANAASFTTGAVTDTTPPVVVSATPANGATGVGRNATMALTFSKPLNANTVNNNTFALFANGGVVSSTIVRSADNQTVFFSVGNLPASSVITMVATEDVQDLAGNHLADFQSSFTTVGVDTVQPLIQGQRPKSQATGVPVTAHVVLYASEPMNAGTIPGALHVTQNGVVVNGTVTVTDNGRTIEFAPASPWANNALVQVFLDGTAQDLDGNGMNYGGSSFTIMANPHTQRATFIGSTPVASAAGVPLNTVLEMGFSKALDPASLVTNVNTGVYLNPASGGTNAVLPATITLTHGGTVIQFVPNTALSANTQYCMRVNGVRDVDGVGADQPASCLTTGSAADTAPFQAQSVTPPNGTANVGVNAEVRVRFNKPVDGFTVNGIQIVSNGVTSVPYSISFANNGQDVLVVPFEPLPANATVTINIAGVTDQAGNVVTTQSPTFTTAGEPDTDNPFIVRMTPFSGEGNVPLNAAIQVQMNEPVDLLTVNGSSFSVNDNTGLTIAGSYTLSSDGLTISFLPNAPLPAGRQIGWNVNGTITDLAGNPLNGNSFNFNTAQAGSTTAPVVSGVSPSDGSTVVPLNAHVVVGFSEPLSAGSADAVTLAAGGVAVPVFKNFSNANETLTLIPVNPLAVNTSYTVTVGAIQDIAGNVQSTPVVTGFTTGTEADLIQPFVVTTDPLNNAVGVGTNAVLHVQFSERVNTLSVNGATVQVLRNSDSLLIQPTSLTVSADGLSATWTGTLAASTVYRFTFFGGVTDLAGNQVVCCSQITFTTGTGADVQQASPPRPVGAVLDTTNPLSTSLVGLFLMNEGSGTTDLDLVDSQNANFSGSLLPEWHTLDPSILFEGGGSLNSFLDAGTDLAFDQLPTSQTTIVAKVFVETMNTAGICEKNDGNTINSGFVFGFDSSGFLRLTVEKSSGDMRVATGSGVITAGHWMQVAFTWDGTIGTGAAAHLFINGIEQTKASSSDGSGTLGFANATNKPFRIGTASFDVPGSLAGRVAYLAVYRGRILTSAEMTQLDTQLPIK